MKTLALIFTLSSLSWACPKGSEPYRDGVCVANIKPEGVKADESAKWVSDEKPLRSKNPGWQANSIHIVDIKPENPADEHHPASCPNKCKWDGATCHCDNEGKKP